MANFPSCFFACLWDVGFLPTVTAADQFAFWVCAPKFLVLLHRGTLGRIGAEGASLKVLDAGHAENGLLFDPLKGSDELVIQKHVLLLLVKDGIASIHRHAAKVILGEADLIFCHASRTIATKPMGGIAVAMDHPVARLFVEAAPAICERPFGFSAFEVCGFFLLLSLFLCFLGSLGLANGTGGKELLDSLLVCLKGAFREVING